MSTLSIREFRGEDRAAVAALGASVIADWHAQGPKASLNLVAADENGQIAGYAQATDRSLPKPSRRAGQCHFTLNVAAGQRRGGIGSALYNRIEQFAARREAGLLYTAYQETPEAPAAPFLRARGFVPLERFLPSVLDLAAFDPARFDGEIRRVEAQGIRLTTYAEAGDNPHNRQRLYALEQAARAVQPFREVSPYIPMFYESWERELAGRDPAAIFLATVPTENLWAGVVTGLEWYFTGVHPGWQGRGLATALKVRCLAEARRRGLTSMETENHEDNAAMLAVNRKLGFVFGIPEVACIKRLGV